MAGRKGLRPHLWKVQGKIPHDQYVAWQKAKAQAQFRDEPWTLTFDEFQRVWRDHWMLRGRSIDDYCMTRLDYEKGWDRDNTVCMQRLEHLRRKFLWRKQNRAKIPTTA
jgi:hypothetical protein